MFAHQVINDLLKFTHHDIQISNTFRKTIKVFIYFLRKAKQFHIENYFKTINTVISPIIGNDISLNKTIRPFSIQELACYSVPPYPTTWIDAVIYGVDSPTYKFGILLSEIDHKIFVYSTFQFNLKWLLNPNVMCVELNSSLISEKMYMFEEPHSAYDKEQFDLFKRNSILATNMAYYLLLAINSKNVIHVDNIHSGLSDRTINRDNGPHFEYKTLKLTDTVVVYDNKKKSVYKDVMPEHDVCGYTRKSGKRIKAYIRGNIKNGRIDKEYVFVNGKPHVRKRKIFETAHNPAKQRLITYTPSHSAQ